MAKSKKEPEKDNVTWLGEDVDADLQKKVESYMEPEVEAPKPSTADISETSPTSPSEAGGAPLLPTDKLPDMARNDSKKKVSKIEVKEHIDEDEPASEPVDEPMPEVPTLVTDESGKDIPPDLVPVESENELEEESEELSEQPEPAEEEPETPVKVDEPIEEEEQTEVEEVPDIAPEPEEEPPQKAIPQMAPLPIPLKKAEEGDELGLETPQTSKAVDEIIATEADELLAAEDAKRGVISAEHAPKRPVFGNPFGKLFLKLVKNSRNRKLIVATGILGIAALLATPVTRYYLLNTAGVRSSTSLKIIDDKTSQPLKNVELSLSGKTGKTDSEGHVRLEGIRLGSQKMVIKKPAFAEISQTVTIGWGSNPLGEFRLTPVGSQYSFILTDFLSGKPITKAEVSSGEASARSNEKGEAVLTVPNVEKEEMEVQITADKYRTEKIQISAAKKEQYKVSMSPGRKQAFVSKRSGKFDLYKIDVDGKNEQLVLAGTGIEREDSLAVVSHGKKDIVAFISTRENIRNKDGYLLSTLNIIDLNDNSVTKIAQSERIQIVDWIGDRLVYVKITQGASEADLNRHKLLSYDIESETEKELASTNYFNDVISANGAIYYSPALYQVNGAVGLYKINADGSNKKTVYQKEAWNLFRTNFDKISVSIGQDWFDLNLNTDALTKVGGAPSVLKSRVYVASPEGKRSIWVDERDGKGVLLAYDHETKQDKTLQAQGGIKSPIRWLDEDHVIYRIADGRETADYALSLSGGEPKKIRDVTNTAGIDRWYYY
jgi:hypothetical protein